MIQVLISLTESAYKEMCENGIDNVDYDIRQMMKNGVVIKKESEKMTADDLRAEWMEKVQNLVEEYVEEAKKNK